MTASTKLELDLTGYSETFRISSHPASQIWMGGSAAGCMIWMTWAWCDFWSAHAMHQNTKGDRDGVGMQHRITSHCSTNSQREN